jgi:hypothetical protein
MAKSTSGEAREAAESVSEHTREHVRRGVEQAQETMEQSAAQAREAANYGLGWIRDFAEQSVAQSKVMFDGFFTTACRAIETFDQQAAEVRHGSISLAERALANTFDYAQKCARASNPQEMAKLQSEFFERQAQIFADHSKDIGQKMMQAADQTAKTTMAGIQSTGERAWRRAESSATMS